MHTVKQHNRRLLGDGASQGMQHSRWLAAESSSEFTLLNVDSTATWSYALLC
jgi:hypothetical protein